MPRIRRDAARLYRKGWSARKIGRYLGYHHTAIMKWVRRAEKVGDVPILTRSSRPHTIPRRTALSVEKEIFKRRVQTGRCAEAIHLELIREGIHVSRNTVHRTLDRYKLLKKRSLWKRYHPPIRRPEVLKPGDLVQIDTIHRMVDKKKRIYVFSLIDVYSRQAHAKAFETMNGRTSIAFIREAQRELSFSFHMLQSDHGPEFGRWFVSQIERSHRYSRIGRPNDNAHIERFNRTLQEECLDKYSNDVSEINRQLKKYLRYYNNQRIHLGVRTIPSEMVPSS